MPKVEKIPCPTPGCPNELPVKTGRTGKPYVRCDDCGVDVFVRGSKGVKAFLGEGGDPPAKGGNEDPKKKPAEKEPKDDWDW